MQLRCQKGKTGSSHNSHSKGTAKNPPKTKPQTQTVPTRDTSLLTGCSVGSSRINPAVTMGMTAVKSLLPEADREDKKRSA